MKFLIPIVVLCTAALFVTLDAAPTLTLPFGFEAAELESLGRQQSDDSEMAKTFLNVFSKVLTTVGDKIGRDGSIQADNELGKTFLNVVSGLLSAASKKADPNDQLQQSFFNGFNSILSSLGKRLNEGGEIQSDDEMAKTFMNVFGTLLSAMAKNIDSGEVQSFDEIASTFFNLMGNMLSLAKKNVDPNDDLTKTVLDGFGTLLSAFGSKFTNGRGSQIQSDDNNGLPGAFFNLLGTLSSALQKKADPKDDMAQTFLSIFNTLVSGAKNKFGGEGGEQEVRVDTLPTYKVQQSIMESVGENAAMAEGDDVDLSEEAKTQLWGAILGSLASGVLNRYLSG